MQHQIAITSQLLALNPLKDAAQVDEIDYTADFDNLFSRMDDFDKFFKTGKISYNMLKYIPSLAKSVYQGQLYSTETKRKYADDTYIGKKVIEFNVQLTANHYSNFQNVHLCLTMKVKSAADDKTDDSNNIAAGVITANNFFAHLIKETDFKRNGNDIPILPLTNMVDIYRYSDEMLKHMPEEALKTIENDLLYGKNKVRFYGNDNKRRAHYTTANATVPNRTDENLTDRITKFQNQLKNECIYSIPLKYLCDLGLVNQCYKFNTKYVLTLEKDIQRLFEASINQATDTLPRTVNAEIILTSASYIMYEQFKLDDNFRTYLKYQISFELVAGTESQVVEFQGSNKQFSFLAISLVYDKSDQYRSI